MLGTGPLYLPSLTITQKKKKKEMSHDQCGGWCVSGAFKKQLKKLLHLSEACIGFSTGWIYNDSPCCSDFTQISTFDLVTCLVDGPSWENLKIHNAEKLFMFLIYTVELML